MTTILNETAANIVLGLGGAAGIYSFVYIWLDGYEKGGPEKRLYRWLKQRF